MTGSDTATPVPAPDKLHYTYRRAFEAGRHSGEVVVRSGLGGNHSELLIDGTPVARDFTPGMGIEGTRNHHLEATLADGRRIEVEAGYINWLNIGIAVRLGGELVHQSHPGRPIAMPERAAKLMASSGSAENYDPQAWNRNRIPLAVDIGLGLAFYLIATWTNLTTAALAGAAIGLVLYVVQRVTKIDLLGGLAMFGIVLLLLSAGLALTFDSDEAVKYRTFALGVVTGTLFLADGAFGGKRLGARLARYLPYTDIDIGRLAIGMGMLGMVAAFVNLAVAQLASTQVWLFYTTFVDFILIAFLMLAVLRYARGSSDPNRPIRRPAEPPTP